MKRVRIGILGCASIAEKYAISAFKSISDVAELVCIASRDPKKAKETATRHGIEPESYDSLLQRKDIDAVYIPLPIGLHEEWTIKSAEAGKHIICEKSLTDSFTSAKKMVAACEKHNLVLYENFMCAFHPQHAEIKDIIKKGAIGKPFLFQGLFGFPPRPAEDIRYKKDIGGGSLNDAGCYPAFMARKILASEPISVTCHLVFDSKKGVDVQGSVLLEFPSEISAMIGFGFDQVYQNNYSIWGQKGIVRTNRAYAVPPTLKPTVELITNENASEKTQAIDVPAVDQFALSFRNFCETILGNDRMQMKATYDALLSQARMMEAMRVSSNENRKVILQEIR